MAKHTQVFHEGRSTYEHVLVAERILGKRLPEGAEVHHIDHDPTNNATNNLVICQNHAYHMLLHRRERAYKACGHADWFRCQFCKEWDSRENMWVKEYSTYGPKAMHQSCANKYQREKGFWKKHNKRGY